MNDNELLHILEDLQNEKLVNNNHNCSDDTRISGYFCSDTVFNLSRRLVSEDEKNKVNEHELRKGFDEFCRQMRIKWHFRNEHSGSFSTRYRNLSKVF